MPLYFIIYFLHGFRSVSTDSSAEVCSRNVNSGHTVSKWYLLLPCVSVRPSITSRSSIKTAERIALILGTQMTLGLSYIVLEGNSYISKNIRVLPLELCP